MSDKFPEKKGIRYTENITIRVEPELRDAFQSLKKSSTKDISEAQRIAWRELVRQLKGEKLA